MTSYETVYCERTQTRADTVTDLETGAAEVTLETEHPMQPYYDAFILEAMG